MTRFLECRSVKAMFVFDSSFATCLRPSLAGPVTRLVMPPNFSPKMFCAVIEQHFLAFGPDVSRGSDDPIY